MVSRKNVILFLLLILIVVILDVFLLTPLARINTYTALILSTFGHYLYLTHLAEFPIQIRRWYFFGIILMCISMLTCYWHYDQPLISGFVANVNFYHIGSCILFLYLFRKFKISLSRLFSVLTKSGWVFLFALALMEITNYAFVNESELTGQIVTVHNGKIYKSFLNFIAIYWLIKFLYLNNYKYLLYSILFFASNHFYEIQRFNLLVIIFVIIIAFFKIKNIRSKLKLLIPSLFGVILAGIFFFTTESGRAIVNRFHEAAKIVVNEDPAKIDDASTAIRVFEKDFALNRFMLHPIFGNGLFRASEKDKIIGRDVYFYPLDIGLYGILYSFGIIGIIVFFIQLQFLWRLLRKEPQNPLQSFAVVTLLFILASSLLTGTSINDYKTYFFVICLLALSEKPFFRSNE